MSDPSHGFIAPTRNGLPKAHPMERSGYTAEAPVAFKVRHAAQGFSGTITYHYQSGTLVRVTQEKEP